MIMNAWYKTHATCRSKKILIWILFPSVSLSVWMCSKLTLTTNQQTTMTTTTASTPLTNIMKHYMTNALFEPSKSVCEGNPYLIILVEANVYHNRKRLAQRRMLSVARMDKTVVARIFVMGNDTKESVMIRRRMKIERRMHKDILLGSFPEGKKYSTYKTLLGLSYVTKECPNVSYILKISEDCNVDLERTLIFLRNLDDFDKNNLVVGYKLAKQMPVRNPKLSSIHPYYVSWDDYRGLFYPPFLSGQYYVTTPQTATRLLNEASHHKYLFLEDVFVTGILTKALNIPVRDIAEANEMLFL